MAVNVTLPGFNLRDKLAQVESMAANLKNLFRALAAKDDGQLLHATIWKDNVAALSAAGVPSASAPTSTAFGPSGIREEKAFAVNDYVFVQPFHINHDIIPGALAYPHVHWSTNGTSTATVKWQLDIMRSLGHGQAAFGAPSSITIEQAASGTAWTHMVTEASDTQALTLVEPDELIIITLKRITNGGTDNSDSVFGLMVDLHYQANTVGTINKAPNFYR